MTRRGRRARSAGLLLALACALWGCASQFEAPTPEAAVPRLRLQSSTMSVMLSAPFVINRRLCEVPLVPGPLRDACVRGFATVQLGASSDDRFFCSQFVLEAYRQAGAPLSDADPRWASPADLLHMREGDVATLAAARPLRYLAHLKYTPPTVVVTDAP